MKKMSIKRIISSMLCFSIISVSMVSSVSAIELGNLNTNPIGGIEKSVNNTTRHSLLDNTIRLNTTRNLNLFNQFWTDFGFYRRQDGRYFLCNMANGIYYDYADIGKSDLLHAKTTFVFRYSDNRVYKKLKFEVGTRMRDVAFELFQISIRIGESVQVIINNSATRDLSVNGFINNNLTGADYSYNIGSNYSNNIAFRLEEEGLYAQYVDQNILPDGNYSIQSYKNQAKSLSVIKGDMSVKAINTNVYDTQQQFNITYDNVKKAYRIKNLNTNDYLSWNSSKGDDVIHFDDGVEYNDQLWYLKFNPSTGGYSLVNAYNFDKFLNLDSNNTNISVAYKRGNTSQQFIFNKID
ncbi:MAG: RICIN domain-containing protein [Oscillospiraceae bacterium]|nr:RICIN domain-containing protein [Oscillospiraceae bacterium]